MTREQYNEYLDKQNPLADAKAEMKAVGQDLKKDSDLATSVMSIEKKDDGIVQPTEDEDAVDANAEEDEDNLVLSNTSGRGGKKSQTARTTSRSGALVTPSGSQSARGEMGFKNKTLEFEFQILDQMDQFSWGNDHSAGQAEERILVTGEKVDEQEKELVLGQRARNPRDRYFKNAAPVMLSKKQQVRLASAANKESLPEIPAPASPKQQFLERNGSAPVLVNTGIAPPNYKNSWEQKENNDKVVVTEVAKKYFVR